MSNDDDMTPEEWMTAWERATPVELNVSKNLRAVVAPEGFRVSRGPRTWASGKPGLTLEWTG